MSSQDKADDSPRPTYEELLRENERLRQRVVELEGAGEQWTRDPCDVKPSCADQNKERTLGNEEFKRYGRQMILPWVGRPGQEKLKESSVLVVGVGGLGAPSLLYLAAAGIGKCKGGDGLMDG